MSSRTRILAYTWLISAIVIVFAMFVGGDTAIEAGWLFLLWTAPFGIIWWFWIYPKFGTPATSTIPIDQVLGSVGAVLAAFLVWFVLLPRLYRWMKVDRVKKRTQQS